jgi:predicted negative regulator of RcsB-dependent stress response
MATSHIDRKELKSPDAFQEKANSLVGFINENARTVAAILAVLFALGIGYAAYSSWKDNRADEASSAFFSARKNLQAQLQKTTNQNWQSMAAAGLSDVEKVAQKYSGTQAGFESNLILGDTYFEHGQAAKAAEYYNSALKSARGQTQKAMAQYALGYALENEKKYDEAIDAMRGVVSTGNKAFKGEALMALARLYELKGDKAKAIEQYDLVSKELPNSASSKIADAQKARLN